jgi:hypothetical protein
MPSPLLPPKLDERGLPPPRVTFDPRDELPFWIFLLVAIGVFVVGVLLGAFLHPEEKPVRAELDYIEGVENEPMPLGDPNAGGPAPEKAPEPEPPQPAEPLTQPEPPIPMPPPEPAPDFPKPDETPPATPAPAPPRPKPAPKPAAGTPRPPVANPKTAPGGTGTGETDSPNAKPGPRGVSTGVPGGKGGQKATFIARPDMPIDNMIVTRKYFGRGMAKVVCEGGRIVSVEMTTSIGFAYCDAKAVQWIRSRWVPRPGASGTDVLPIIVKP